MKDTVIDFLMNPANPDCRTVVGNCEPGKGRFNLEKGCHCELHDTRASLCCKWRVENERYGYRFFDESSEP